MDNFQIIILDLVMNSHFNGLNVFDPHCSLLSSLLNESNVPFIPIYILHVAPIWEIELLISTRFFNSFLCEIYIFKLLLTRQRAKLRAKVLQNIIE